MKKGKCVGCHLLNDCGKRYLVKHYAYRGEIYLVYINLDEWHETREQHEFCQKEIDRLKR